VILGGGADAYTLTNGNRGHRFEWHLAESRAASGTSWHATASGFDLPAMTYGIEAQAICST
jgi:hypothetical protein